MKEKQRHLPMARSQKLKSANNEASTLALLPYWKDEKNQDSQNSTKYN